MSVKSVKVEPAIKSYFFGKGYRDLGATIAACWQRNWLLAQEHMSKAGDNFNSAERWKKLIAALYLSAGISVVVSGTAFFVLASVAHIAVLGVFFALVYLAFTCIYLIERMYLGIKGFFNVCPLCHHKFSLPVYRCPGCNETHRQLRPSRYGILSRICTCGTKLPATFFTGRNGRNETLRAECPECSQPLDRGLMDARKSFIAVVGGPMTGKSAFLCASLYRLMTDVLPRSGVQVNVPSPAVAQELELASRRMAAGRPPDKTSEEVPHALTIRLDRQGRDARLLYLYDPAGETFGASNKLSLHKFQRYVSGVVFLLDPFTIPALRHNYQDRLQTVEHSPRPSSMPLEDVLSHFLIGLEEHFGLSRTKQIAVPVAVVVNKIDAFDLEHNLAEVGVQQRNGGPDDDNHGDPVRAFLLHWEQGSFVQRIEARCRHVRYFACSSLGRSPDNTRRAFAPRGVMEPLRWILRRSDPWFEML